MTFGCVKHRSTSYLVSSLQVVTPVPVGLSSWTADLPAEVNFQNSL